LAGTEVFAVGYSIAVAVNKGWTAMVPFGSGLTRASIFGVRNPVTVRIFRGGHRATRAGGAFHYAWLTRASVVRVYYTIAVSIGRRADFRTASAFRRAGFSRTSILRFGNSIAVGIPSS